MSSRPRPFFAFDAPDATRRVGRGRDSGRISEVRDGGVNKGLFDTYQGTIVPESLGYKLLKSMYCLRHGLHIRAFW